MNVNVINSHYILNGAVREITKIDGYPHVMIAKMENGSVIAKELCFLEEKLDFLEKLYAKLEAVTEANIPLLNSEGRYISRSGEAGVLLFEELEVPETYPSAKWWAGILAKLHLLDLPGCKKKILIADYLDEVTSLLSGAKQYMAPDIKNILGQMLDEVSWDRKIETQMIVNHGDPLNSNVMLKQDEFRVIDFENACVAPKEYDIQRRMWDFAIECDDPDEMMAYWNEFKCEYEAQSEHLVINRELLCYLYIIDFCKTMCWLYLVSTDEKRVDYKRQKKECDHFEDALRKGNIQRMLRCINEK